MSLDEGVSKLIGRLYSGVDDNAAWDAAMDSIVERTNTHCMLVSTVDVRRAGYTSTRFYGPITGRFADGLRDYERDYHRLDPVLAYCARFPDAGVMDMRTAGLRRGLPYEESEFGRWHRLHMGLGNATVRFTHGRDGISLGLGINPTVERDHHSREELALFRLLFGHVENAMRLAMRPPAFTGDDRMELLLDRGGRVRALSDDARSLLAGGDGLILIDGEVRAAIPRETQRLNAIVRAAMDDRNTGASGGTMRVTRPSGRRDLIVSASPLPAPPAPFDAVRPAVLLSIVDLDSAETRCKDRWRAAFGLSLRETQLAEALLAGDGNLRDCADRLGMRYGTARVHLRHLFEKTGARTQSQLALLLDRVARG